MLAKSVMESFTYFSDASIRGYSKNIVTLPLMSLFDIICLGPTSSSELKNKSKLNVNFRSHISKRVYFLHKMFYLGGQLHQNVNEMVIDTIS